MGDDYDSLCVDMLEELNHIFSDKEQKPAKTLKQIEKSLTEWNRRRLAFEQYRKVYQA